jgi:hypothetical protein
LAHFYYLEDQDDILFRNVGWLLTRRYVTENRSLHNHRCEKKPMFAMMFIFVTGCRANFTRIFSLSSHCRIPYVRHSKAVTGRALRFIFWFGYAGYQKTLSVFKSSLKDIVF